MNAQDPSDTRRRPPVPVVPPDYVTVEIDTLLNPATVIAWAANHGARGAPMLHYLRFQKGKEEQVIRALENIAAQVRSVVTLRKMREEAVAKARWEEEAMRARANGEQPPPIPVGVTVLNEETAPAINLEESAPNVEP